MWACKKGHIDIARMLLGEYHAHIDIQNRVRVIARLSLSCDVRLFV